MITHIMSQVMMLSITLLALNCQTVGVNKSSTMMNETMDEVVLKTDNCNEEDCSGNIDESPCACGGEDMVANCNEDGCGGDL